jgi:hypothetical protein
MLAMLSHYFRCPLSIARSYDVGLMRRMWGEDLEACLGLDAELDTLERMTDNLMLSLALESQHQLVLDLGLRPGPTDCPHVRGDATHLDAPRDCFRIAA